MLKRSFGAVVDAGTRLLILGSLPGEESLARGQYYAHPRNQFWRLIGAAIGTDLVPLPYPERLSALLAAHVGLWDVVASATRRGSLDGNIRDHSPNDLRALVGRLPELRAIAFNGGTSGRIGRKQLGPLPGITLIHLPSSSPAFTIPFERKREAWIELRACLGPVS